MCEINGLGLLQTDSLIKFMVRSVQYYYQVQIFGFWEQLGYNQTSGSSLKNCPTQNSQTFCNGSCKTVCNNFARLATLISHYYYYYYDGCQPFKQSTIGTVHLHSQSWHTTVRHSCQITRPVSQKLAKPSTKYTKPLTLDKYKMQQVRLKISLTVIALFLRRLVRVTFQRHGSQLCNKYISQQFTTLCYIALTLLVWQQKWQTTTCKTTEETRPTLSFTAQMDQSSNSAYDYNSVKMP